MREALTAPAVGNPDSSAPGSPEILGQKSRKRNIHKLLEDANLSPEEVLENLSSLMRSGETDGIRMRAVETAAKINGLLEKDEVKQDLTVNIIIQDSQFGGGINPILIPRA
jgi:hypothetical protein